MLDNSKTKIVLSEQRYTNKILDSYKVIDVQREDIYQGKTTNLEDHTTLGDLIDIIYISGSTGNPKGFLVPYRGMVLSVTISMKRESLTSVWSLLCTERSLMCVTPAIYQA